MEYSFDVDPEFDVAMGTEISFDEAEGEYGPEDFTALGVDPTTPTVAKPGSEDKVRMLAARYAAGLPLWHDGDCYDHGPSNPDHFDSDGFPIDDDEEF